MQSWNESWEWQRPHATGTRWRRWPVHPERSEGSTSTPRHARPRAILETSSSAGVAVDPSLALGMNLNPLHHHELPPPLPLRLVQRVVDPPFRIRGRLAGAEDAEAAGGAEVAGGAVVVEGNALQRVVDAGYDPARIVDRRIGEENRKLVAAHARDDVGRADRAADHRREADQRRIARRMSQLVVDRLEKIEVDHRQRGRPSALRMIAERFLEEADVVEAGQRIVRRRL